MTNWWEVLLFDSLDVLFSGAWEGRRGREGRENEYLEFWGNYLFLSPLFPPFPSSLLCTLPLSSPISHLPLLKEKP